MLIRRRPERFRSWLTRGSRHGLRLFGRICLLEHGVMQELRFVEVNWQIANWLGYQDYFTAANALTRADQPVYPAVSSKSTMNEVSGGKSMFAANVRLAATMPDKPVELAQPVHIPVKVTGGDIVSIIVEQHSTHGALENEREGAIVGSGEAEVVRDDGETKTVEVIPLQVGDVNLEVFILFTDGALAHQSYPMTVVPSSKGLKEFDLNQGSPALAIVLEDKYEDRQHWLFPEVRYKALKYPIYLEGSEQIKFTVDQPQDDPVIRVDSNGMVHGLRPGMRSSTLTSTG